MSPVSKLLLGLLFCATLRSTSIESSRKLQESTTTYPNHCRAGCLICSTKDMCLLCDLSLNYIPHGYDCVRRIIENCDKTTDGETCVQCKTGYFLGNKMIK